MEVNDVDLSCLCGRYLYSGRVVLRMDSVLGLFMLADKYDVLDLKSSCVQFMRRHLVVTLGDVA